MTMLAMLEQAHRNDLAKFKPIRKIHPTPIFCVNNVSPKHSWWNIHPWTPPPPLNSMPPTCAC
ncbi:MAG TPA: hypothetical protein VEQ09_10135, partial [Aquabacterium sp.]|nr:hypothetical protein [Aquabacterium sp.]